MANQDSILSALHEACHSQSSASQTAAMNFLHKSEGQPAVLPVLIHVLRNREGNFSEQCRLLAVICIKNNVDRCWTQRGGNAVIPPNEKDLLRSEVFEMIGEENNKLSIQIAVLISRIARCDWPQNWTNLFDLLFQCLRSPSWTLATNSMQALLQVVLVLNGKKLARNKAQFCSIATEMLQPLSQVWNDICEQFFSLDSCPKDAESLGQFCAMGNHLCTCTRILQILMMLCFNSMRGDQFVQFLYQAIGDRISTLSSLLTSSDVRFEFSGEECGGGNIWASVGSWQDGNDPVDSGLPSCGEVCCGFGMDAVDCAATVGASGFPPGQHSEYRVAASLTIARVLMSLSVIPLHLQQESKHADFNIYIMPVLDLYFALLQKQFVANGVGTTQCACEPLALVYTLFISNALNAASGADNTSTSKLLGEYFLGSHSEMPTSRLQVLFDVLVERLLRLPQRLLQAWGDDPEELFSSLQSASEGDSLRLAAEGLYSSMVYFSPDEVCALVLSALVDTSRQQSLSAAVVNGTAHIDEVLHWEALYMCAGLSPYFLSQRCDSGQWISSTVGPMLSHLVSAPHSFLREVISHRMVWLMSCWAHTLENEILCVVIQLLVAFLHPSSADKKYFDVMVRLQVVKAIETILHAEVFNPEMVLPQLEGLLSGGCQIVVHDLSDANSQVQVVNLFKDIVDTVGVVCRPHLLMLVNYMLMLWESSARNGDTRGSAMPDFSADDNDDAVGMLRSDMIDLFTSVVKISGGFSSTDSNTQAGSRRIHDVLYPVISYSTSASDTSSHLCKHGVELWTAVVRNTSTLNPALKTIFIENIPRLFQSDLIGSNFDEVKTILCLLEGYVIVGGWEFVCDRDSGEALLVALRRTVGQVKARAASYALRPVQALLMLQPSESGSAAANYLLIGGIVWIIVRACAAGFMSVTSSSDEATSIYRGIAELYKDHLEADVAIVSYLSVCARLLVISGSTLLAACKEVASAFKFATGREISGEFVMKGIIRLMLEKFDAIGYSAGGVWHKRVCCLSLLSFYPTDDADLLSCLPEILYAVDDVLCEERTVEGKKKLVNLPKTALSMNGDDSDDEGNGSEWAVHGGDSALNVSNQREQEDVVVKFNTFLHQDPSVNMSLQSHVVSKLNLLAELIGQEKLERNILQDMNSSVLMRIVGNQYVDIDT